MKTKKLHIIFLDFDDIKNPLLAAGQAVATFEVASRLVKSGHRVTVISSKYPRYKDRNESGIYYKHIGIGTKNIKLNNLVYILAIPFAVRDLRGDIIVECFTAPVSTLLSPLFTKIPVVALPTSFEADRFSKLYHFPFWIIEKYGSRFYKYFIALTPYLAEKMKKYNPTIVTRQIPQGVSHEYFTIVNKKAEYILFLGRLDISQKGLDLLLNAYAKISKEITYPLLIAGDGPDKKRVKELITKLQLSKRVRLVGFADMKKKMDLFSKAAFVGFPSRNEGFSLVSLETIASGHRLVSFTIPSLYWAKEDVARKVKSFDINEYSKALLLESKQNSLDAVNTCRDHAKKYSWDTVTKQFEDLFYTILRGEK